MPHPRRVASTPPPLAPPGKAFLLFLKDKGCQDLRCRYWWDQPEPAGAEVVPDVARAVPTFESWCPPPWCTADGWVEGEEGVSIGWGKFLGTSERSQTTHLWRDGCRWLGICTGLCSLVLEARLGPEVVAHRDARGAPAGRGHTGLANDSSFAPRRVGTQPHNFQPVLAHEPAVETESRAQRLRVPGHPDSPHLSTRAWGMYCL